MPLSWPIDWLAKNWESPAPAGPLHEKYGLCKTREAEDMCNYSQFLVQKGKAEGKAEGREEGREEQKIKDKLDFLEELDADHCSDERILKFLRINAEQLKSLREMLQEKRAAVMAD